MWVQYKWWSSSRHFSTKFNRIKLTQYFNFLFQILGLMWRERAPSEASFLVFKDPLITPFLRLGGTNRTFVWTTMYPSCCCILGSEWTRLSILILVVTASSTHGAVCTTSWCLVLLIRNEGKYIHDTNLDDFVLHCWFLFGDRRNQQALHHY